MRGEFSCIRSAQKDGWELGIWKRQRVLSPPPEIDPSSPLHLHCLLRQRLPHITMWLDQSSDGMLLSVAASVCCDQCSCLCGPTHSAGFFQWQPSGGALSYYPSDLLWGIVAGCHYVHSK